MWQNNYNIISENIIMLISTKILYQYSIYEELVIDNYFLINHIYYLAVISCYAYYSPRLEYLLIFINRSY
jgi:hypothetical protein